MYKKNNVFGTPYWFRYSTIFRNIPQYSSIFHNIPRNINISWKSRTLYSTKKVVSSVEYSIRPPVESQFFWTTTPPPKQLSRTFAIPLLFIFITLYTVTRCLTLSEGLVNGVASLSKDWNILTHSCIVIGDMHIMKPGIMMVAMGTDPIRFFPGPSRPSRHMTSTISQIYEL